MGERKDTLVLERAEDVGEPFPAWAKREVIRKAQSERRPLPVIVAEVPE